MTRPPKPPEALVEKLTHHSIDLSWEPYQQKLQAKLKATDSRIRAEVEWARTGRENAWEMAYRGHDVRCVLSDLVDDTQYQVRYRFGVGDSWGDFSNPVMVKTQKKPFSGQDVHRQVRLRNPVALQQILETGNAIVDAPDDRGFTPLTVAALEDKLDMCQILLEFNAAVDFNSDNGKTALMLVSCKGKTHVVRWLLDNGADIMRRDRRGMSPLHYAVDGEQIETVRLLIDRGVDIHARDNQGCTPMVRCAMLKNNGNSVIAGILARSGARVDDTDSSGQSALFYCALNKHSKMAGVLLEHGADPRSTNTQGVSVLDVADAQDRNGMGQLLKNYAAKNGAAK